MSDREKTKDGLWVEALKDAKTAFAEAYNQALNGPTASLALHYGISAAILAYERAPKKEEGHGNG